MIIWHALGSHWKPLDLLKFIQVVMLTLAVTQFTTEETNSFFSPKLQQQVIHGSTKNSGDVNRIAGHHPSPQVPVEHQQIKRETCARRSLCSMAGRWVEAIFKKRWLLGGHHDFFVRMRIANILESNVSLLVVCSTSFAACNGINMEILDRIQIEPKSWIDFAALTSPTNSGFTTEMVRLRGLRVPIDPNKT